MSYQKTIWENGDTITAEKLNNIEQGIENSNSIFIIPAQWDYRSHTFQCEITPEEVLEAVHNKKFIVLFLNLNNGNNCIIPMDSSTIQTTEETEEIEVISAQFVLNSFRINSGTIQIQQATFTISNMPDSATYSAWVQGGTIDLANENQ